MNVTTVVRADNWWGSKLPPLFAVAYAQILLLGVGPWHALAMMVAVLVVTGGATGAYGHVVNDIFDLEVDRRIGKTNSMALLPVAARWAICSGFAVMALLPALLVPYPPVTTALVAVELLLPALYSIPPVRLKERGMWGVFADAAGAHVVPALIVVTAFAGGWPTEQSWFVVAVVLWSIALGLKGILWHQRLDREDDLRAGARTFVASSDPSAVARILGRLVYPIEVASCMALVTLVAPAAPLVAVVFLLAVALDLTKRGLGWSYVFDPRAPELRRRHAPLVSNYFYELGFPLALAVHLTLRDLRFAILLAVQLAIFSGNLREQLADLCAVVDGIRRCRARAENLRRFGWVLEVHSPAAASLEAASGGGVRVEVGAVGEQSWQVKLVRGDVPIASGHRYKVRFEVRAETERSMTYCVVAGEEPWHTLGLSEEIVITPDWIGIVDRFVASASDERGEICALLGQSRGAVELKSFSFDEEVAV